jgi:hypothetical protein
MVSLDYQRNDIELHLSKLFRVSMMTGIVILKKVFIFMLTRVLHGCTFLDLDPDRDFLLIPARVAKYPTPSQYFHIALISNFYFVRKNM